MPPLEKALRFSITWKSPNGLVICKCIAYRNADQSNSMSNPLPSIDVTISEVESCRYEIGEAASSPTSDLATLPATIRSEVEALIGKTYNLSPDVIKYQLLHYTTVPDCAAGTGQ